MTQSATAAIPTLNIRSIEHINKIVEEFVVTGIYHDRRLVVDTAGPYWTRKSALIENVSSSTYMKQLFREMKRPYNRLWFDHYDGLEYWENGEKLDPPRLVRRFNFHFHVPRTKRMSPIIAPLMMLADQKLIGMHLQTKSIEFYAGGPLRSMQDLHDTLASLVEFFKTDPECRRALKAA